MAVQPAILGFLFDLKGEVLKFISTDGRIYDNLSLKLDLVEHDIHYLNDLSQELILHTPVSKIILTNFVTSQSKGQGKKMEEELIRLTGQFNKKAR